MGTHGPAAGSRLEGHESPWLGHRQRISLRKVWSVPMIHETTHLGYSRQAGEKALARSAHRLALRSALRPLGDFGRILAALREAESLAVGLAINSRKRQNLVLTSVICHFPAEKPP